METRLFDTNVSLHGASSSESREALLERARRDRRQRKENALRKKVVVVIQRFVRGRLALVHWRHEQRSLCDAELQRCKAVMKQKRHVLVRDMLTLVRRMNFVLRPRIVNRHPLDISDQRRLLTVVSTLLYTFSQAPASDSDGNESPHSHINVLSALWDADAMEDALGEAADAAQDSASSSSSSAAERFLFEIHSLVNLVVHALLTMERRETSLLDSTQAEDRYKAFQNLYRKVLLRFLTVVVDFHEWLKFSHSRAPSNLQSPSSPSSLSARPDEIKDDVLSSVSRQLRSEGDRRATHAKLIGRLAKRSHWKFPTLFVAFHELLESFQRAKLSSCSQKILELSISCLSPDRPELDTLWTQQILTIPNLLTSQTDQSVDHTRSLLAVCPPPSTFAATGGDAATSSGSRRPGSPSRDSVWLRTVVLLSVGGLSAKLPSPQARPLCCNLLALGATKTREMHPTCLRLLSMALAELLDKSALSFVKSLEDAAEVSASDQASLDAVSPLFDASNLRWFFWRSVLTTEDDPPRFSFNAATVAGDVVSQFLSLSEFPMSAFSMTHFFLSLLKNSSDAKRTSILNCICFSTPILSCLWSLLLSQIGVPMDSKKYSHEVWEKSIKIDPEVYRAFELFVWCYNHILPLLEADEFQKQVNPFDLKTLLNFSRFLKDLVFKMIMHQQVSSQQTLYRCCHSAVKRIYQRNTRSRFAPEHHWELDKGDMKWWEAERNERVGPESDPKEPPLQVLRDLPFVIPFSVRVDLLREYIAEVRGTFDPNNAVTLTIRRNRVVEDGFDYVNRLGKAFRSPIKVRFIDKFQNEEAGIDLGGVFKEFMEVVAKEVFGENHGLFASTDDGQLYPNPVAASAIPEFHATMEFVGRILGKSLYEGIVLDVPFARFFLSKLLGEHVAFDDLRSLDKELYKNLMFLKHYDGDVQDLALDFTISVENFGAPKQIPLIANGANVDVTNANRIQYIYEVANYHLNRSIRRHCDAFAQGFFDLIDQRWILMFNSRELQQVISGDNQDIDVDDWCKHTRYDAPFYASHRVIKWFWKSVRGMPLAQKQQLLRFVTSASRPPLLGFRYLDNPPFTIRPINRGEAGVSVLRLLRISKKPTKASLPTAATCFNVLRLPLYATFKELDDKLKTAIQQDKGFALS